jgi:hypothetical protein
VVGTASILCDDVDHAEAIVWDPFASRLLFGSESGPVTALAIPGGERRTIVDATGFVLGIAVDGDGDVHLCDWTARAVRRCRSDGSGLAVESTGPPERPFVTPNFLAFHPSGTLFVSLEPDLLDADRRGVRIFSMIYGDTPLPFGSSQTHSYHEIVASRIGGHMLILVADSSKALVAQLPERGEPIAVRTTNPVLSLVTEEYMRHDIVLQKAKSLTGFDEWDRWWKADPDVRAVMLGKSLDTGRGANRRRPQRRQPVS